MKKTILLAAAILLTAGIGYAQHGHDNNGNQPHHHQHHEHHQHPRQPQGPSGLTFDQALAMAFPDMLSTKKEGRWTAVYDSGRKLLGYAVDSRPASDGIKGYAGETPVMIAFSPKKKITGVYLLQNQETPGFARRVEQAGFYAGWNGLTVKKALKKKVDTVSGATFTSRAVAESVRAALATL